MESTEARQIDLDHALDLLRRVFDDFDREIAGRRVLDFGCGAGLQACAMARLGGEFVLGLDTNPRTLARAVELASSLRLGQRVRFAGAIGDGDAGRFDIVISQNSMEHFPNPAGVLDEMKRALAPGGKLFVTFGPPWLAPYGSHMRFMTSVPWVNVLFPETAVMKVRSRYIADGARRYQDVEGGLNKMTVGRFEELASESGLQVAYRRYDCVKGLSFLGRIPLARELFINHVSCVLTASDPAPVSPSGREASWPTSPLL